MPPKWIKVCDKYPKNYSSDVPLDSSTAQHYRRDTGLNAQAALAPAPDVAVETVAAPEVALAHKPDFVQRTVIVPHAAAVPTPDVAVETVVVPEGWSFESVYTEQWL